MGRVVRRVPANWEHPKDGRGNYKPMHDRSYDDERDEWYRGAALWFKGEHPDQKKHPKETMFLDWHEWHGEPPDRNCYLPAWPAEERTYFQMYEDTSEGTPISPAMEDPEQLARWLADNSASAFADMTATYEQWLAMIYGPGWAPSAMITGGTMISGIAAMAEGKS